MAAILDNIVARKRVEVEKAKSATPLETLKERVPEMPRPRHRWAAISMPRCQITPTKGPPGAKGSGPSMRTRQVAPSTRSRAATSSKPR